MRNNDRYYYLYCHTNKINGKKYIGISVQKPNHRWKNGRGYKGCPKFKRAIEKYGWENFTHEILLTQLTHEEASEKEKEYIAKYDTVNNGYNVLSGGLDNSANGEKFFKTRPINQYSLSKTLIKTWDSMSDIERELHIGHQSISNVCSKITHTAHGYIWRYQDDCGDINDLIIKNTHCQHNTFNTQQRLINQYDLDGNLIKQWNSIDEASKSFNKSHNTAILNCCDRRGRIKSAYGYQWRYSDDCDDISKLTYTFEKEIYEIDTQNNIIHTFNKRKDVEDFYSTEKLRVYDVLYHKQKSTHGHIFIYADEYKEKVNG